MKEWKSDKACFASSFFRSSCHRDELDGEKLFPVMSVHTQVAVA